MMHDVCVVRVDLAAPLYIVYLFLFLPPKAKLVVTASPATIYALGGEQVWTFPDRQDSLWSAHTPVTNTARSDVG